MFKWFVRRARTKRAAKYLKSYPDDYPAVQAILSSLELEVRAAREVAEMLSGRKLTDNEWNNVAPRWERTWNAVISGR